MDIDERQLILGLADRLRTAHPAVKEAGAAELITSQIASQPDAVYLLVQAVLVQEDALRTAQARIEELSAPAPAQQGVASGGLLGSLFGKGRDAGPAPAQANTWAGNQPAPAAGTGSGGGFLKTAAVAAAGVAGGGLLLHGLTSAFSGPQHSAPQPQGPDSFAWDSGADDDW